MNFFKKLFGRKRKPVISSQPSVPPASKPSPSHPSPTVPQETPAPAGPVQKKDLIRVFDSYGREMFFTRQDWRNSVLPGTIKAKWNDPNELYNLVYSALVDGFRADIVPAAERLYAIDTDRIRGACVWGIVLMEEGRLDEAEGVFRAALAKCGEDGSLLTNLAKVYSKRKREVQAEETLWHALEVDPNQDNSLLWYAAIYRERSGEAGQQEAFRRVAVLPGSWRAQLWLARAALDSGRREEAMGYYHECLSRAPKPFPADLLMQVSGDLGNHGCLSEIVELVAPHFDAKLHGIQVGNNLLKAHVDLHQLEAARELLEKLYAVKCPPWNEVLQFWETEISKARLAGQRVPPKEALRIALRSVDGPIWLPGGSPVAALFPVDKPGDAIHISFLGCTADKANEVSSPQVQMADAVGRASRMLPLFLAEQVYFGTQARVQTLIPRLVGEAAGFVVSGVAWSQEEAAHWAREADPPADYVVVIHLLARVDPWTVEVRIVRTIDGMLMGSLKMPLSSSEMEEMAPKLAALVQALLVEHAGVETQESPTNYQVPSGANLPNYLLRLEQLLAVRCSQGEEGTLMGEREIVDGNIHLCLVCPENITTRTLLAQTMRYMKRVRPQIIPEFAEKIALLQRDKPLPQVAHDLLKGVFDQL